MNNNIVLQHYEKNDTINTNIYSRNIPSANLQMNFAPRSVSTKYSHMPILDHKNEPTVILNSAEKYNSEQIFYPGSGKPHFCGFASNVDAESTLRNQFFALQKADQASWVPSSSSNLYENPINFINTNRDLNAVPLFRKEQFDDYNPNISNFIGNDIFNNSTRVQLKNI